MHTCGNFVLSRRRPTSAGTRECQGTEFAEVALSRTGTVWSYTDACYQPPEPYVAADPYVPFAIAAVELAAEQMVVMGQVVPGVDVDDLLGRDRGRARARHPLRGRRARVPGVEVAAGGPAASGQAADGSGEGAGRCLTTSGSPSSGRACTPGASGAATSSSTGWPPPATPWPRPASPGPTSSTWPGPTPSATATPASSPGATFAQALGWTGARVSSAYAACASGAQAITNARAQILAGLCDVALVVGADTTPKGFFAPVGGERKDDPDWLRFHLLGATNPTYFALYARRRMELFGATEADFAAVKVKNARHGLDNPNARYRKEVTAEEVLASPMVADPLRLLEICATSDGGAALVLSSMEFARRHAGDGRPGDHRRGLDGHPALPPDGHRDAQLLDRLGRRRPTRSGRPSSSRWPWPPTRRPASDPRTSTWPRSTTSRRPSSSTGTRTSGCARRARPSGCSATATPPSVAGSRSTRAAGSSCFGEAIPAQAIAQVCELVWQLRGQADGRQVEGARVGITANQGLFGHGSSVIVSRSTGCRLHRRRPRPLVRRFRRCSVAQIAPARAAPTGRAAAASSAPEPEHRPRSLTSPRRGPGSPASATTGSTMR